jgi:hypothetical protein
MTREFKKQRRDDSRPSLRPTRFNGHKAERFARQDHPRLNRETVDRAWESGARHHHADYLPRDVSGRTARNGRYNRSDRQDAEQASFQRGRTNKNRTMNSNHPGPHQDASRGTKRHSAEPRMNNRRDGSDESFNANSRSRNYRAASPARVSRESQTPYRERQGRGKTWPRDTRETHDASASHHQAQPTRTRSSTRRGSQGRQSPPPSAQQNGKERRNGFAPQQSTSEMFEGDYERFTSTKESRQSSKAKGPQKRDHTRKHLEAQESHVTRMPDGRTLKGSRSSQRQQAQFWTDVTEETNALLENVHIPTPAQETDAAEEPEQATRSPQLRTRTANNAARQRKSSASDSQGKIPRPSQRGFKWPTP